MDRESEWEEDVDWIGLDVEELVGGLEDLLTHSDNFGRLISRRDEGVTRRRSVCSSTMSL